MEEQLITKDAFELKGKIKNLVFKGCGAKGVAYVGAMQALEKLGLLSHIKRVAGSSSGSIIAILLAIGYTVEELHEHLTYPFAEFKDAAKNPIQNLEDLINNGGVCHGDKFKCWLATLIENKLGKPNATFADLHQYLLTHGNAIPGGPMCDVFIIGTNLSEKKQEIFSWKHTPNVPIVDAARISISLPGVFEAIYAKKNDAGNFILNPDGSLRQFSHDEPGAICLVDGGVINNYAIELFDKNFVRDDTLGFYSADEINDFPLQSYNPFSKLEHFTNDMMYSLWKGQEREKNHRRTVFIPSTEGVGVTTFDLKQQQIEAMMKKGFSATMNFANHFGQHKKNMTVDQRLAMGEDSARKLMCQRAKSVYRVIDETANRATLQLRFNNKETAEQFAQQLVYQRGIRPVKLTNDRGRFFVTCYPKPALFASLQSIANKKTGRLLNPDTNPTTVDIKRQNDTTNQLIAATIWQDHEQPLTHQQKLDTLWQQKPNISLIERLHQILDHYANRLFTFSIGHFGPHHCHLATKLIQRLGHYQDQYTNDNGKLLLKDIHIELHRLQARDKTNTNGFYFESLVYCTRKLEASLLNPDKTSRSRKSDGLNV